MDSTKKGGFNEEYDNTVKGEAGAAMATSVVVRIAYRNAHRSILTSLSQAFVKQISEVFGK